MGKRYEALIASLNPNEIAGLKKYETSQLGVTGQFKQPDFLEHTIGSRRWRRMTHPKGLRGHFPPRRPQNLSCTEQELDQHPLPAIEPVVKPIAIEAARAGFSIVSLSRLNRNRYPAKPLLV